MRKFLEADTGDDLVVINVIHMYDTPLQIEGVEPGETSEEVQAKYMEFMIPELFSRASHPEAGFARIPCIFPVDQGFRPRDEFAAD